MGWSGGYAEWTEGKTACLSIVFSWKLPHAYMRAVWYKAQGYQVHAGGGAVWSRPNYLKSVAQIDVEPPNEPITHHNPQATIASRGCPVNCYFCIVPKMEGTAFTLLPDFIPRPILCDSNLSALPIDYQDYIIQKYLDTNTYIKDATQGFEPHSFTQDTYQRWKIINKGDWRFAFDTMDEEQEAKNMASILSHLPSRKKRVYVLIGNEPFNQCLYRINKVIEWGCEPFVQPFIALRALRRKPVVKFDWNETKLKDMARWANRFVWRTVPFSEYKNRKNG